MLRVMMMLLLLLPPCAMAADKADQVLVLKSQARLILKATAR